MPQDDLRRRHKQGMGGVAVTVIVDGGLHYLDLSGLVPIGIGAALMIAVWAFAPDIAAYLPPMKTRKSAMPMVLMVVGLLLFCGGAIWSAAMAGADKTKPPVAPQQVASPVTSQGPGSPAVGSNSGPITTNIYNGPVNQTPPPEQTLLPATKLLLQREKILYPIIDEYKATKNYRNPGMYQTPEAIEFFNNGLKKKGVSWRVTAKSMEEFLDPLFLHTTIIGPGDVPDNNSKGIVMRGNSKAIFDDTQLYGLGTAIDMDDYASAHYGKTIIDGKEVAPQKRAKTH